MPKRTSSFRSPSASRTPRTPKKQPAPEKSEVYIVERIVAKRFNPSKQCLQYFVKWLNWSEEDNTWESLAKLRHAMDQVSEFEREQKEKREQDHREGRAVFEPEYPRINTNLESDILKDFIEKEENLVRKVIQRYRATEGPDAQPESFVIETENGNLLEVCAIFKVKNFKLIFALSSQWLDHGFRYFGYKERRQEKQADLYDLRGRDDE